MIQRQQVKVEDQPSFTVVAQSAGNRDQQNRIFPETAIFANREKFSAKGEELRQV